MMICQARISEFTKEEFEKAFSLLSGERQNAVLRMRFENDRKRSVLGEYLVRNAVFEEFGVNQADLIIRRTENGKPFCENVPIHFSIGHSKDLVVCGIHNSPIGVDVEFIRQLPLRITRFSCNAKDLDFINCGEDQKEKELRFFRLWTAKEAFIKFHGGILADLKSGESEDIKNICQVIEVDGYIATVYTEE